MNGYLKKWLEHKNVHPDDIEEILEAEEEDTLDYIRHDLYILYREYEDHLETL